MDSSITAATPPGISWTETFAGVLFAPAQTMRDLAERSFAGRGDMDGAVLTVCLVFGLDAARLTDLKSAAWMLLNVPLGIFLGLLLWLSLAGTLALLSACLNSKPQRIQTIFVTTGWSFAPWILMAPISLYHWAFGGWFGIFVLIPLLWMIVTQVFAVKESFSLSTGQTLALYFVLPCIYAFFSSLQFAQAGYVALSAIFG